MNDSKFNGSGPVEPTTLPVDQLYGRAALLLAESLMHALVDKGVISQADFIEIVEGAAEVEQEFMNSNGPYPADRSGALLPPLATAFKRDLGS